jgi:hypothetical protein
VLDFSDKCAASEKGLLTDMKRRVALIRYFQPLRNQPSKVAYGVFARPEDQKRPAPKGTLVESERALRKLLEDAGLPACPSAGEFLEVSEEQLRLLGIDVSRLD